MEVKVDYVSDVHLGFYIDTKNTENVKSFVDSKIAVGCKGDILVVAGDISEYNDILFEFLDSCSKYYDKVFFVVGNHEYYITDFKHIHISGDGEKYGYKSMNKIKEIADNFKDSKDIIFLDKNSSNGGIYDYKSSLWIYGHDHKENDEVYNNTRFISNPWGYDSKDFKIKSLVMKK